MKVKML